MRNLLIIFCFIMAFLSLYGVMTIGHILWHIAFLGYATVGTLTLLLIPEKGN
jgi:hypothetical protein